MRWGLLCLFAVACGNSPEPLAVPACAGPVPLTAAEVETIIAQAVSRALADGAAYVVTVVNREGVIAGQFRMAGLAAGFEDSCARKARTAAFLSSNQHAFNTRTAFHIIQDNFPPGIENTPGGPLYGVQFSSLACSDAVGVLAGTVLTSGNGLSGDFGSVPLYRAGCLVGAVAVDGGVDSELEEGAAWAGSAGFRPALAIRGSRIFIDGVKLPFVENMPPDITPVPPFGGLAGVSVVPPMAAPPPPVFPVGMFGGLSCEIWYPVIDSPLVAPTKLLAGDVTAMLNASAALSVRLRAGIRRPLGSPARVFISVTDTAGNVLGSIRTPEATLFSFDVSIQKARAASFFSTDTAAFTTRALGFMAQGFYPPGLRNTDVGPLNGLQDALSAACEPVSLPLQNGITIFPGGVPLYKAGILVGAIGVSGDGVDQDDMVSYEGARLFPPADAIRCDALSEAAAVAELRARVGVIAAAPASPAVTAAATLADTRLALGLKGLRLPYVRFPRQPFRE